MREDTIGGQRRQRVVYFLYMALPRPSVRRVIGGLFLALLVAGCALGYFYRNAVIWAFFQIRLPGKIVAAQGIQKKDLLPDDFKVMATGLRVPWAMGFLPDGSLLVTERPGTLKRITPDGSVKDIAGPAGTRQVGEGGLLGLAVHPHFDQNRWIYVYQTTDTPAGLRNRVMRYRFENDALTEPTTIIQNIPAAAEHDGGALAFGPDGRLYIGTGDAGQDSLAQDLGSLAGKVLRVNDDASIPSTNPFGTPVWSYGHRNIEGLAFDGKGRLWATEHGRSGLQTGLDELNLIEGGANYGWPTIEGDEVSNGLRTAAIHSGPTEPWAPAGVVSFGQGLLFGGLRGEALYQAKIEASPITVLAHFEGDFGRIRTVTVGPDRMVYIATSNTDGRGLPRPGDDRIIRVNPRKF